MKSGVLLCVSYVSVFSSYVSYVSYVTSHVSYDGLLHLISENPLPFEIFV